MRLARAAALALVASLAAVVPATAAPSRTVSASSASGRACDSGKVRGAKRAKTRAPVTGLVRARLKAAGGDWDLAVFGKNGRTAAASEAPGSRELAEGFVRKGERLTIQACRFSGNVAKAHWSVSYVRVKTGGGGGKAEKAQLVRVRTRNQDGKRRLQTLGLDLTEKADATSIDVILHGDADAQKLRAAGFTYQVVIADLAARSRQNAREDKRFQARIAQAGSGLTSGSTSYRHLYDYQYEMKQMVRRHPDLVKPITLNHRTYLGRTVNGIEITTHPRNTDDGKPIFLIMGVHHAREWPSSESTIEFAYDLLDRYRHSARIRRQVRSTRVIVVPVINPDGFNVSREAAPLGDFSTFDYEMKRKNCKITDPTPPEYRTGTCDNNPAGVYRGVDPNRNYGGIWGGGGASTNWSDETYRGDGPFSEAETQNVHELVQNRQVTNLITNHTFSGLVLRVPGVASFGFPLDEPQYKALGRRFADHNAYRNIPGFQLYDTTGGTEDWSYWTAGAYSFTFEIGLNEFHPPYEQMVDEYLGRGDAPGAGKGGNQAAYFEMLDATADRSYHSVITGKAPRGAKLQISKRFMTATSPVWQDDTGENIGDPIQFPDYLETEYRAKGGRFQWDVNPSTRPIVAGRYGRDPSGPPQAQIDLANPPGIPAENQDYPSPPDPPYDAIPFTVQGPADGVDNGKMTVHIQFGSPDTDWDVYVYNKDTGELITSSAGFGDTDEDAIQFDPEPGNYEARVINWDGGDADDWSGGRVTFDPPTPARYGPTESWTLKCFQHGRMKGTRQVTVLRGQSVDAGRVCGRRRHR